MSLKKEFLEEAMSKISNLSALCRKYEISRPTAYKWLARYAEEGCDGLVEKSRRPGWSPSRTRAKKVETILRIREQFPAWGARKLRKYLMNQGHQKLPCEATFNRILQRNGKIQLDESVKRKHFIRFERASPNELWQMDFKGHFKLAEGRCHPLTVLDDHSRYSICLKAFAGETTEAVRNALTEAFRTYGLPDGMTMDNGSPWKGSPPWTLSRLSIWLMRLGIKVGHSSPRHPQTQGKDERFHRSLKDEVLRFYQFRSLEETQKHFDTWREIYNFQRPHEGIGMECPAQRYQPSKRPYPEVLPPIEYEPGDVVRKVQRCGTVSYMQRRLYAGEHLKGEYVALRQGPQDGTMKIYFCRTLIGKISLK
jgi:transposase InsO family protein